MQPDLRQLQRYVALVSIGVSTLRGQGPPGMNAAAHEYLQRLDLATLSCAGHGRFARRLDAATEDLRTAFPRGGQHWGSARKALNIFLRDAFYNRYLCRACGLAAIAPYLEVPLDSYVASRLRGEPEGVNLPRWSTIKGLKPEVSASYQQVATTVARRRGTARVHLDLLYWRA